MGDLSFAQAQIENFPPKSNRGTNFLCFDVYIVKQKADLSSSNDLSKQLYFPPCDFFHFCNRESHRRGIRKLESPSARNLPYFTYGINKEDVKLLIVRINTFFRLVCGFSFYFVL